MMSTEEFDILRFRDGEGEHVRDVVSVEVPVTIYVNGEELVTLLASPTHLKELSVGFLVSSGILRDTDDVRSVALSEQKWRVDVALAGEGVPSELIEKRMYTSGCGKGTLFATAMDLMDRRRVNSALTVSAKALLERMKEFNQASAGYKTTGGEHSAALCDTERILVYREDIGRHNAVDKVIGHVTLNKTQINEGFLLTSGRVSSEIVFKARRAGLALLASRSAPTNQAVRHARAMNLTLAGFVRGRRMNIYSGEDRVQTSD